MKFTKDDFETIDDVILGPLFKNFKANKPIDAREFIIDAEEISFMTLETLVNKKFVVITGDLEKYEKDMSFYWTNFNNIDNFKPDANSYYVTITDLAVKFKRQRDAYIKSLGGGSYPEGCEVS